MPAPAVVFAARMMLPQRVGGLEQLSADVLAAVAARHRVIDLSNRGGPLTQLPYLATLRSKVRRALREVPDAVVDGSDASLAPALAGVGRPVVVRVHGLDLLHRNPLYQALLKRSVPRMTLLVANSRPTAALLSRFRFPAERVRVIHPVAEAPAGWVPRPERGRFLLLGRLVPRKGAVSFVERVWPLLSRDLPSAVLDVVGDGPDRDRLRNAVAAAPRRERIHVHGALPRADLERRFESADALVLPNLPVPGDFEGFGIVAIEAASRGVPVVARAVDGIVDAVLPETGVLVPGDDPASLSEALASVAERKILSDRDRIRAVAAARWGRERLAREYAAVLDEARAS